MQLRLYRDPGAAEIFINLRRQDEGYERQVVTVDTGAEVSLLPQDVLNRIAYRPSERGSLIVGQAGIANQIFEVTEVYVWLFLEDEKGERSREFEVRMWFGATEENIIGYDGILDRATLFIDTRVSQTGWIELD
jgi:predicted aspartyl protease